jgi:serine/threonine protein kinase
VQQRAWGHLHGHVPTLTLAPAAGKGYKSAIAASLVPGSTFAGHRVEALLGSGAMGHVYLARESDTARPVALKVLGATVGADTRFRRRFEREARLAASFDHPHVVPVYRSGEENGTLYITMRYVDGPDLRTVIAERGPLHPGDAALIVSQVGAGLDAAAAAGLVHRDVKPGNVFVQPDGGRPHAYLGDFGLSKAMASTSGLTHTGFFVGTIDYASPEQLQAEKVDHRTDVYALGALLYKALTGSVPFPREREVDKVIAQVTEPPPAPSQAVPEVPAALDAVVQRAMSKNPAERYESAGELGSAAVAAAAEAGPAPSWPGADAPATPSSDPDAPTVA